MKVSLAWKSLWILGRSSLGAILAVADAYIRCNWFTNSFFMCVCVCVCVCMGTVHVEAGGWCEHVYVCVWYLCIHMWVCLCVYLYVNHRLMLGSLFLISLYHCVCVCMCVCMCMIYVLVYRVIYTCACWYMCMSICIHVEADRYFLCCWLGGIWIWGPHSVFWRKK